MVRLSFQWGERTRASETATNTERKYFPIELFGSGCRLMVESTYRPKIRRPFDRANTSRAHTHRILNQTNFKCFGVALFLWENNLDIPGVWSNKFCFVASFRICMPARLSTLHSHSFASTFRDDFRIFLSIFFFLRAHQETRFDKCYKFQFKCLLTSSNVSATESLAGKHARAERWHLPCTGPWEAATSHAIPGGRRRGQRTEWCRPNGHMIAQRSIRGTRHQHSCGLFNFEIWRRRTALIAQIFDVHNRIVIVVGIRIVLDVRFGRHRTVRCVAIIFGCWIACGTIVAVQLQQLMRQMMAVQTMVLQRFAVLW